MPQKWETKFKPGDKVKLNCDGTVGVIVQVNIMLARSDIDYWEKALPRRPDGTYQHTSYEVTFDKETHVFSERGLTLR